ncbi:hypothetical protein ACPUD8_11400 [Brevibacterium sp. FAM 25378]|uniref:hypothetical protein n=1 Tax=unclassified Brevibacterium TaxID=2614124 RepID=UPI001092C11E|nr:hypothetical protein [Brevibacterium sp. S22]TGD32074.1 hypothetical protein EB835_06280 [Brevibacterium sp. S22]
MAANRTPARTSGPPLPPIAVAAVGLMMAALILPIILASGATFPSPYSDAEPIVEYFRTHPNPVLVTALLQFAASLPLGIFAAVASVRLNHLGVRVPGPTIGLLGGVLASSAMALSALLTWTLTRPEVLDHPEIIRLVHDLAFITGGPGFIAPLGLLIAGIAVPGLLAQLLPRWHAWAGLVTAGLAMIAILSIAVPQLSILLPIARFLALAWIVTAAFLLPRRRPTHHRKES